MKELIHSNWRPSTKTINTLKAEGWSDEQRKSILITFINRYLNEEIEQASTKYRNMLRSSGIPHNAPKREIGNAIKEREEKRSHKSPKSLERAKEVKEIDGKMSQEAAIEWLKNQRG